MPQQSEYLEILKEIQGDVVDVVKELISEEVMPLLKERQKIERTIGNKEIREMYEWEKEAG